MPTNEERREVVGRLRNFGYEMGRASASLDTDNGARILLAAVSFAICDNADTAWKDIVKHLADLIEPEPERTCRNISDPPTGFYCSACRWGDFCEPTHLLTSACFRGGGIANYCPNCGAKVVGDAD